MKTRSKLARKVIAKILRVTVPPDLEGKVEPWELISEMTDEEFDKTVMESTDAATKAELGMTLDEALEQAKGVESIEWNREDLPKMGRDPDSGYTPEEVRAWHAAKAERQRQIDERTEGLTDAERGLAS